MDSTVRTNEAAKTTANESEASRKKLVATIDVSLMVVMSALFVIGGFMIGVVAEKLVGLGAVLGMVVAWSVFYIYLVKRSGKTGR